jgi:hypothetical protein
MKKSEYEKMIENKNEYFIPMKSWIILEREEIVDY